MSNAAAAAVSTNAPPACRGQVWDGLHAERRVNKSVLARPKPS